MILVGQYDSPYTRRVAIALHLLELPFERNTLSGFADAEAMRRINPLGRIPSLILDDGEVLIDSAAILDHLDETAGPARALLPRAGAARRRALQLVALATGILDKAGAVVYERALRPPDKIHQPWIDRCLVQVRSGLDALEGRTGDRFTIENRPMTPDVTAVCVLDYLRDRLPEALDLDAHRDLLALLARFGEHPAWIATAPTTDEIMPQPLS